MDSSVQGTSSVDKALIHLYRLIDLRRVLPGEVLPSAASIAKEINVNRTAVLQALQTLQRQGLITIRRGRGGARVIGRDNRPQDQRLARAIEKKKALAEVAVLRQILDSGIARMVASRGLQTKRMQRARQILDELKTIDDRDRYLALDTEFHELLADATGSQVLKALSLSLRQMVLVGLDAVELPPNLLQESNLEHERLLAAIEKGSATLAADWGHKHSAHSTSLIDQILGTQRKPSVKRETGAGGNGRATVNNGRPKARRGPNARNNKTIQGTQRTKTRRSK